jgi:hypothetical protein
LVVVVVAVLAGCGSTHARRNAVNTYFTKVDKAQQDLLASTGEIDQAFQAFSLSSNKPAETRELRRAQSEIGRALTRVRAISPPPDARRVHSDLVRLLGLELAVSHELVWTVGFQPRFSAALAPLPAASRRLASQIAAAGKGSPKLSHETTAQSLNAFGSAFTRFGASLGGVQADLDKLSAPPTLRPSLLVERRTLRRSIALCHEIASQLARKDVNGANASIHDLFLATAGVSSTATRNAQAAAVRAYDRRLAKIAALSSRVARDRQQLVQAIG